MFSGRAIFAVHKHFMMAIRSIFKSLSILLLSTSIPVVASAQFEEGDNVLGLGIGILGGYNVGWSGGSVNQSPALNVHFDHGMGDLGPGTWGLGGYVGYKTIAYKAKYYTYQYDYRYNYLVIGARGTWHYNEWHGNEKLDTYGGLMLAYRSIAYTDDTNYGPAGNPGTYSYSGSGLGLSVFVGTRYYFSDNVAVFGELGYGLTTLQLGVAFKF